ncbi:uncharacterized protein LOC8259455 isoform X2 [Ricinus communis]|uniref:uncharacterized protein LOC8259455 isoform X2 n=1 Tax=Ricinus communis TaxID=3988 RepID=UPI0007728C91|nr:uncharacterized protein LOC8259455 isoform X2 [Ricinus communis]|eukprot:XP_025012507.1 uncharacterized protein LOC8259455 isoform X2 [Ricinus communis]
MFAAMESLKGKCKAFFSSRGCFGCCIKPSTSITVDNSSKGLRNQEQTAKQLGISDDFWSTSAGEMDYSGVQSQRSVSSISTLNQPFDPYTNAGSTSNPSEFVNHGLLLWKQTRQQWLANKKSPNKTQVREPTLSWNATYENLLGTNKPFPRRIPLAEMVDFLVDVWEQEGLYD